VRLTAVIPATHSPPTLARCLEDVRGADEAPEDLVVVEEPRLVGHAQARNLSVARSTAEVVVFVDSDVVVARDAFVRVRAHFRDDPSLTAVFGSYEDSVGTTGLTARFSDLLHHHVHPLGRASDDVLGRSRQIRGTHLEEWTLEQMLKTDFGDRGIPWIHLLLARREVPTTLNLGCAS